MTAKALWTINQINDELGVAFNSVVKIQALINDLEFDKEITHQEFDESMERISKTFEKALECIEQYGTDRRFTETSETKPPEKTRCFPERQKVGDKKPSERPGGALTSEKRDQTQIYNQLAPCYKMDV